METFERGRVRCSRDKGEGGGGKKEKEKKKEKKRRNVWREKKERR